MESFLGIKSIQGSIQQLLVNDKLVGMPGKTLDDIYRNLLTAELMSMDPQMGNFEREMNYSANQTHTKSLTASKLLTSNKYVRTGF